VEQEELLTRKKRRELAREEKRRQKRKLVVIKNVKRVFFILLSLALLFFLGKNFGNLLTTPQEDTPKGVELRQDDWVRGKADARVVLIEYSDFQCPACGFYKPIVQSLLSEFEGELKLVYRHFPLTNIHKNALLAAKVAEAAGLQGKFWEMHDLLFEKREEWENLGNEEIFLQYAESLGLDKEKFEKDLNSKEVEEKVFRDIQSANALRLNSTPSFFLQGKKISPRSVEDFRNMIKKEIEKLEG